MSGRSNIPIAEAHPEVGRMVSATADGRRLRLELGGCDHAFVVDPIPAKRGRALRAAHDEGRVGRIDGAASEQRFAEVLGPHNYALLTGNHVQVFDESGRYLRTFLPGAVMVEPAEDVPAIAFGERLRVVDAPWDGLPLRVAELEALALTALYWQTDGV